MLQRPRVDVKRVKLCVKIRLVHTKQSFNTVNFTFEILNLPRSAWNNTKRFVHILSRVVGGGREQDDCEEGRQDQFNPRERNSFGKTWTVATLLNNCNTKSYTKSFLKRIHFFQIKILRMALAEFIDCFGLFGKL